MTSEQALLAERLGRRSCLRRSSFDAMQKCALIVPLLAAGLATKGLLSAVVVAGALTPLVLPGRERRRAGSFASAALVLVLSVPTTHLPVGGTARKVLPVVAAGILLAGIYVARRRIYIGRAFWALAIMYGAMYLTTRDYGAVKAVSGLNVVTVIALLSFLLGAALDLRDIDVVRRTLVTISCSETIIAVWEVFVSRAPLFGPQLDLLGHSIPLPNHYLGGLLRAQGTLGHPLPLSLLIAAGLIIASSSGSRYRLVLIGWLLLGLFLAGSLGGFVIVIAALLIAKVGGRTRLGSRVRWLALVGVVPFIFVAEPLLKAGSDSGSVANRLASLGSASALLRRSAASALFGNGYLSVPKLFQTGVLTSVNPYLQAIDNQYVTALADGGVLQVGLLLFVLLSGFRNRDAVNRRLVLGLILILGVFDVLTWTSLTLLAGVILGYGCRPASEIVRRASTQRPQ